MLNYLVQILLYYILFLFLNHLHEVKLISFFLIFPSLHDSNIKQNVLLNQLLCHLKFLK